MDKQILEILKAIQTDLQEIKAVQGTHTKILEEHTKTLNGITDEAVRLREDMTVVKDDIKESKTDLRLVKIATVEQANEIEKLKAVK